MNEVSKERQNYLRNIKRERLIIKTTQISILVLFIFLWEILANYKIIDSFITSKPSKIAQTFVKMRFVFRRDNRIHNRKRYRSKNI